jgi:hypothetical protein
MPRRKPAAYFQFMIEQVETIIVGGGQAGLAVGYQLTRLERQFVILDAHQRTGDSWRTRWDSLQLFTPAHLNALPGLAFPGPQDRCSTKDEMADYLEAYAARFDLPVRRGIRVEAITRNADRLVIMADDQRFEADNVVLATGGYQLPTGQASQTSSTPAFCNSTRVSTGRLRSCRTVTCSSWAPQTPEQILLSRPPQRIEHGFRDGTLAASQPAQEAGSTGSSPRPSGSTSPELPARPTQSGGGCDHGC